jgi:hypothetical protein
MSIVKSDLPGEMPQLLPRLLPGAEAPLVDDGAMAKWSALVAAAQRQNSLECNPCINAEHGDVVGVSSLPFHPRRGFLNLRWGAPLCCRSWGGGDVAPS